MLTDWLAGQLAGWPTGRLAGRLAGWLAGRRSKLWLLEDLPTCCTLLLPTGAEANQLRLSALTFCGSPHPCTPAGSATTITSIAEYTTNPQRRRRRTLLAASGVNVRTQVTYTSNVTAGQFAQDTANGDTPWLAAAYPGGTVLNVTQNGQAVQPSPSPPPPRNRPPPPFPRCGHAREPACMKRYPAAVAWLLNCCCCCIAASAVALLHLLSHCPPACLPACDSYAAQAPCSLRCLPLPHAAAGGLHPPTPVPGHLSVLRRSMAATCVRSSMKALWGSATASLLARRVKMRSTRPTRAEAAGTKLPTCARKAIRATCRQFRENKAEAAN